MAARQIGPGEGGIRAIGIGQVELDEVGVRQGGVLQVVGAVRQRGVAGQVGIDRWCCTPSRPLSVC